MEAKNRALFVFPQAAKRHPDVERWFDERGGELGIIARKWFEVMRDCGDDVQDLLHDMHPTACVHEAAFGYVNVFRAHVNVGFFRGAEIDDPHGMLVGSGKLMRHIKIVPGDIDGTALKTLIETAYVDMKRRLDAATAADDRKQ